MSGHVAIEYETPETLQKRRLTAAAAAAAAASSPSSKPVPFSTLARMPSEGFEVFEKSDNVAIATTKIPAGTAIRLPSFKVVTLPHTVLEGHRFCVEPIATDGLLTSWSLPFAVATKPIVPGDYVCNAPTLKELRTREDVDFELPAEHNFRNLLMPYHLDEENFQPDPMQVPVDPAIVEAATFQGYARPGKDRGVGTRNAVIILGSSSRTAHFATSVKERFLATLVQSCSSAEASESRISGSTPLERSDAALAERYPNVDGVHAVVHTEGGGKGPGTAPNNLDLLLRTLSGFVVHPNVGGALVLDYGDEHCSGGAIARYMADEGYPVADSSVVFVTLSGNHEADMDAALARLQELCTEASKAERTAQPASSLRLALQCGGSDAFSGVSGNPLAGHLAKLLIQAGGAAVQAETDELVGAESYFLSRCRSFGVARKFLHFVERFKTYLRVHGGTAEGNPSGGNVYRGLYNIALKSLGAGMKKPPDVRLDGVFDYGERIWSAIENRREVTAIDEDAVPGQRSVDYDARGFFFMDSPGNDLESIAGQVASGCNILTFTTGNGAITNFPFVPTIKIVTTTSRYNMLTDEMDINAGRFQDGEDLSSLADEYFAWMIRVASGERTKGERLGHSQISIWRTWTVNGCRGESAPEDPDAVATARSAHFASDPPVDYPSEIFSDCERMMATRMPNLTLLSRADRAKAEAAPNVYIPRGVALLYPTSLCSSEVAKLAARNINSHLASGHNSHDPTPLQVVVLSHTEGCGSMGQSVDRNYDNILVGHTTNPMVQTVLFLEHGCEKRHNNSVQGLLRRRGVDDSAFGWTSIQLGGGTHQAIETMCDFFRSSASQAALERREIPWHVAHICVGVLAENVVHIAEQAVVVIVAFVRSLLYSGCNVVLPTTPALLASKVFRAEIMDVATVRKVSVEFAGQVQGLKPPSADAGRAKAGTLILMECEGCTDWSELLTGLGSTGVSAIVALTQRVVTAHPFIPTLFISQRPNSKHNAMVAQASSKIQRVDGGYLRDADFLWDALHWAPGSRNEPEEKVAQLADIVETTINTLGKVVSGVLEPKAQARGSTHFQIYRGETGHSV